MIGPIAAIRRLAAPVKSLFVSDAFGGILLIAITACALLIANSDLAHAYHAVLHGEWFGTATFKLNTLHLWINDGLMAIFFYVVGLEVKREMVEGSLADAESRRLPVLAATAGMAAPAAVYLAVLGKGSGLAHGWAIPAATDIAFAMGVIGLLGSRVPASLRLFLLTVAIVDDIGAVVIIALFYTASIKLGWLLAGLFVFAGLVWLNRRNVESLWPYVLGALALWFCVLHSGVHATIAGVLAALTLPLKRRDGSDLLAPVEHHLAPVNAYLVVPVFALANAGIDLRELGLAGLFAPLPLAIAAGLVIGKQVGIMGALAFARATGFGRLPEGAGWLQMWGIAVLCGIGFTMSLFIGGLAFDAGPHFEEVKLGVMGGSALAGLIGYAILRLAPAAAHTTDESAG